MKKLSELIDCDYDIPINGIADDSRNVRQGYLYVATSGFNVDHFNYIKDAICNGAVFLIVNKRINIDYPHLVVDNINDIYRILCKKFYDVDFSDYSFIGITGTDGKTTTTMIIKQLLNKIYKTAYIGTNGVEVGDVSFNISNTTPCVEELTRILKIAKDNNSKNVVMEVSSESLLHKRVNGISYDLIGFTNITEDHLNVHKTLDNYIRCKKSLLKYLKRDGFVIVNGDDKVCKNIMSKNVVKFGYDLSNDCIINDVENNEKFKIFELTYLGNTYKIRSPFFGKYNVYNVTMAFLICLYYGISPEFLVDNIPKLINVKGRSEKIDFGQDFEIILDYAHTLNGIKNIMENVNKTKRLIVVTGCAGGREKEKRRQIGKYILDNSDVAIFTMDDPRWESVYDIVDDMTLDSNKAFLRIIDRKSAIYRSFEIADKDSVVLILGKGRDNYMAIGDKRIPYNDYDVISSYFIG